MSQQKGCARVRERERERQRGCVSAMVTCALLKKNVPLASAVQLFLHNVEKIGVWEGGMAVFKRENDVWHVNVQVSRIG